MAKRQNIFYLEQIRNVPTASSIIIVGNAPVDKPFLSISIPDQTYFFVKDEETERFAINILKALGKWPSKSKEWKSVPATTHKPVK